MKYIDYLTDVIRSKLYRKVANALFTVFLIAFFLMHLFDVVNSKLIIIGFIGIIMVAFNVILEEVDDVINVGKKYIQ